MIEREIHKLARLAVCLAAVNLCVPMVRATTWTADVGKTRVYYIAADEVEWNYAPSGGDEAMGMPFDAIARGYTESGPHRIGSVYKKAVYREYTDATFTKLKPRAPEDQYLGLMGPIMHAEVGTRSGSSSATMRRIRMACIRTVSNTRKTPKVRITTTAAPAPTRKTAVFLKAAHMCTSGKSLTPLLPGRKIPVPSSGFITHIATSCAMWRQACLEP